MKLNSLRLLNFRQHADTQLTFTSGLTGIIGPNGAGKSTILEAIAWAIYGKPAARGTRESIRFNRAGPRDPVRVDLDFELRSHRYRVSRGLTSAELYLDGDPTPIATSLTGVTELLQRQGTVTLAQVRDLLGTSRRYVQALLERMDEDRITVRRGDERVLRNPGFSGSSEQEGSTA